MPTLEKATLLAVKADQNATPLPDESPIEVQFNPASLKLTLKNAVSGGRSRGRQRRQGTGNSSTTLAMELVFDSADETEVADDGTPTYVSVREKLGALERFLLPQTDGSETPPRVQFAWGGRGGLALTGIIEGLDIEFDLFAPDGTPLRAKTSVTIKEQDPKYQYLEAGPGARDNAAADQNSTSPGADTNDTPPGPGADDAQDQVAKALDGESPADLASRLGLDPAAWRGLSIPSSIGLSLEAGIEVGFSAGISASLGIGVSAGFAVGAELSVGASLGLETSAKAAAASGTSPNTAAGLALSAAGGVGAAIEQSRLQAQAEGESAARSAFAGADGASVAVDAVATPTSTSTSALVGTGEAQSRTPLSSGLKSSRVSPASAEPAPPPPLSDPRAASFGSGVPLRPLIRTSSDQRQPVIFSDPVSSARSLPGIGNAPWERLPQLHAPRERADEAESKRRRGPCDRAGMLRTRRRP